MSNMIMALNGVAPEVAERLAQVARDLRFAIYGAEGFPVWGTKFGEIEQQGMAVGLEMARLFMEQTVADQAQGPLPEQALEPHEGEVPKRICRDYPTTLETPAGEIQWGQPQTRLTKARRDFFPSGQSAGD
jgi:hypothetical protein